MMTGLTFFFLETAGPVEVIFHVEPAPDWSMKLLLNGLGQMIKMAPVPLYGKKSSSPEPAG